jgi:peroxin-5
MTLQDADDLARTAGSVLETIKDEQNPKFQNSQFMGLMKQLRDRMVIVQGNDMVENDGSTSSMAWATDFQADVTKKGRTLDTQTWQTSMKALDPSIGDGKGVVAHNFVAAEVTGGQILQDMQDSAMQPEGTNDAYFRQENEEFIQWNHLRQEAAPQRAFTNQTDPWGQLQSDWDQFEANSAGIKAIDNYQFQSNNPYLLGDSSKMRHIVSQTHGRSPFHEVFLPRNYSLLHIN